MKHTLYIIIAALAFVSCGKQTKTSTQADTIALSPCPVFDADSAMARINEQCAFGPRVTGTEAHRLCGDYIVQMFEKYGCTVEEQKAELTAWDGTRLPMRNIIASSNPAAKDRVMICAHWDSRPWADNDPDEKNHHTPILAASDAASGVAVMLEMARVIQQQPLSYGVDFICFDAEDWGVPDWADDQYQENSRDSWCLGSTYWAEHCDRMDYDPRYGVLFDMVGSRGARFAMEGYSLYYAPTVVQMLWHLAEQMGYGQYFPISPNNQPEATVTDDHVPVNEIARIPCIDIIPHFSDGMGFGPTWHTISDTPENIDPAVMKAVGQTTLQMLYNDESK